MLHPYVEVFLITVMIGSAAFYRLMEIIANSPRGDSDRRALVKYCASTLSIMNLPTMVISWVAATCFALSSGGKWVLVAALITIIIFLPGLINDVKAWRKKRAPT